MRILLDENLDRRLKRDFESWVDVVTVVECGWKGVKNGELLQLASEEFDALITGDQNLEYQQNLTNYHIGIIVLAARTNRLVDLQPLIPQVHEALQTLQPRTVVHVTTPQHE